MWPKIRFGISTLNHNVYICALHWFSCAASVEITTVSRLRFELGKCWSLVTMPLQQHSCIGFAECQEVSFLQEVVERCLLAFGERACLVLLAKCGQALMLFR